MKRKANGSADELAPLPKGNGSIPKVEKYGWIIVDKPGKYLRIDKALLHIDHEYQRTKIGWGKVNQIAAEWSWAACLSLGVIQRPDGTYWVFDGQHRKLAADKRIDVPALPCMVFTAAGVQDEAKAFLRVNCGRGSVRAIDKFNALVGSGDPAALTVQSMVQASGYEVRGNVVGNKNTVKCVGCLMRAVSQDQDVAQTAWNLSAELFAGEAVTDTIFDSLFYLESFLKKEEAGTLTSPINRAALLKAGPANLTRSIAVMKEIAGGGSKSAAEGVVRLLNKGRRSNQLPHPYLSDE